jgi:hypothetical protein
MDSIEKETITTNTPVVIRSAVPIRANYQDYREELRKDFLYTCAYCTKSETESRAVGWTIDHYFPQKYAKDLVNEYRNLMWSCSFCNNYKKAHLPKKEDIERGITIVKADKEDPTECYEIDEDSLKPVPRDEKGKYNIAVLHLDRRELIEMRKRRQKLAGGVVDIKRGINALLNMNTDMFSGEQRARIVKLREKMKKDARAAGLELREFIEKRNHEAAIDRDVVNLEEKKTTREYLKSIDAICETFETDYLAKHL